MTGSDDLATSDWKKTVRRNKLLGMWAAGKMGIKGRDAEAYSDALAVGVLQSDEQILGVMTELTLEAGNQMPVARGGAPDALAVVLARQLKSE